MLFYETVDELTLNLLRRIQGESHFDNFVLVGGTALALQIGHRISIDLDFFEHSNRNVLENVDEIRKMGEIKILNQTERILNLRIDNIKVDFVSYYYAFIDAVLKVGDLRLASLRDIAAMKLSAVTGRGTRKDFVDIFFLLDIFTFSELIEFYKVKYPDSELFQVFRSLSYFDDAELEPMPKMIKAIEWTDVKDRIKQELNRHFKE